MEAYATANGKLWLAYGDRKALDGYLAATALTPLSDDTLTGREVLLAEMDRIRENGFATNRGEREVGLGAVAVPIFGRLGRMVAGISIFAPANRMDAAAEERALRLLRETAEKAGALFQ
ncbi:HTH-type transcriptional regulator YiaJ [compost metagenome]